MKAKFVAVASGCASAPLTLLHALQSAPSTSAPPSPSVLASSIISRMGCLFLDYKARPAFCAMYTAIKLGEKVAKGALLGVFYGESQWLAVMGSNGGTWPHHCTLGQYAYSSRCTAP
jgi:hypothetical protein